MSTERYKGSFSGSQRLDKLELDIDIRLRDLWAKLDADPNMTDEQKKLISSYFRAAYGHGYSDALIDEEPGQLHKENGYRVPDEGDVTTYVHEPYDNVN